MAYSGTALPLPFTVYRPISSTDVPTNFGTLLNHSVHVLPQPRKLLSHKLATSSASFRDKYFVLNIITNFPLSLSQRFMYGSCGKEKDTQVQRQSLHPSQTERQNHVTNRWPGEDMRDKLLHTAPLKRRSTSTRLHDAISQQDVIFSIWTGYSITVLLQHRTL
jgi:hypothetical protein